MPSTDINAAYGEKFATASDTAYSQTQATASNIELSDYRISQNSGFVNKSKK